MNYASSIASYALSCCIFVNPIWGGGIFTLSAIYRGKSPQSRGKVGAMVYQNLSWDICDPMRKVLGPKMFCSYGLYLQNIGVMGYQNLSWDICDLTKNVTGPKNF